jgi:hypothetical protein
MEVSPPMRMTMRNPPKSQPRSPLAELRQVSAGLMVMLVIEFGLGVGYNLYGSMPTAAKSIGVFQGPDLILHEILGLIVLGGSGHVLMKAVATRRRLMMGASIVGALSILGAGISGALFLGHGNDGASMAMAMATGLAMLCCLVNIAAAGAPQPDSVGSQSAERD